MKRIKQLIFGILLISFTSCTFTYPGMATNNPVGDKTGTAERTVILGIALGKSNVTIANAADNGNIDKVSSVNYEIEGGLFSTTYRIIVSGE